MSFMRTILKTDQFVIISNQDFPKDIAKFRKNNEYDLEAISKTAAAMGVSAVIEGKLVELKAKRIGDEVGLVRQIRAKTEATVQIRVAASKNGRVILDDMRSATLEDSTTRFGEGSYSDKFLEEDPKLIEGVLTKAFFGSVPKILQSVEKLTWEGRVALVKGDRIYLNAGRLSGIQVGDILKVTEEGEDVFDPETGALLGRVPGRLKGTVEVVNYFGKDGAVAVTHSGSGFRENDLVELY
jgi:hypothetical protein